MEFSRLEQQNSQLAELIDELLTEKHVTLNKIVADYMLKCHMFHKKANGTFQTLSSIDTEGHKTAAVLSNKTGADGQLHRFTVID